MVSIIICTFNRSKLLNLCLERIIKYSKGYENKIEIIVIDNNSTDSTFSTVKKIQELNLVNIKYIFEKNVGLSYARNSGGISAHFEWLFYLDDDALINENTLTQLFYTINNYQFDIFGGGYKPYYIHPKPKWISDKYGLKEIVAIDIQELQKDYIEGCIMVIKKSVFNKLGGFNVLLGMKGFEYGYNEESEFIRRAKNQGYKVGINPFFEMEHIVNSHKLKLINHFKLHFALGEYKTLGGEAFTMSIPRILGLLPFRIIKYFLRFILKKDFYFENFLWNSFNTIIYLFGHLYGKLIKFSKSYHLKMTSLPIL